MRTVIILALLVAVTLARNLPATHAKLNENEVSDRRGGKGGMPFWMQNLGNNGGGK